MDKYKAGIYAFVYTELRNFHDAEDVTQEVFLQAYRGLRSLRRWESFSFWLYRIALNLCKKWIRTQTRRPDSEFIEDQDPRMLEVLSADFHREDRVNESLREALDSLPRIYREVIMLHYFGGMDTRDIAEATGTSPSTVRKRLSRARAQLREEMIAMMGTAFEEQRLQASFTFRIMEAAKRVGIDPMPRTAGLPWGLSLAAGIIIAVLSIGSHLNLPDIFPPRASAAHTSEPEMAEVREMSVEVLSISRGSVSFDRQSNGYGSGFQLPNQQNATLMALRGEGGEFPEEPSAQLGKGYLGEIAYSPDGKILAAAGGLGIRLYDASNLNEIALIPEGSNRIAFSPDGKTLAVSDWDYSIQLWDVNEQTQIGILRRHTASINSIAFSLDGKLLASCGYDKTIRLWDIRERKQIGVLQGHTERVRCVAFSPDGTVLASGSYDKTIRLWDVQEQRQIVLLQGHTDEVRSVAFSSDGRILASGSWDGTIRLWNLQEQKQIGLLGTHTAGVTSIALSPDGKTLASGSWDRTIRLWDLQEQEQTGIIEGFMDYSSSLAFSPDGKTLASTDSGSAIRLWDLQERGQTAAVEGFTNSSISLTFSPDGKLLASGESGQIRLWDIQKQEQLGILEGHSILSLQGSASIAFSPDGKIIASINNDEIHLFDVQKQERIGVLKGHTMTISSIVFTPDGKTLVSSGNQDQTVRLWDVAKQKESGVLRNNSWVHTVAVSPDGETIAAAVGAEDLIRLWNTKTQEEIGVLNDPITAAFSVAFSPDGETIASCNQLGIIRIWDYKRQKLIDEFQGPKTEGSPSAVIINFSPDGKWLVSHYYGNTRFWDVQAQKEIATTQERFHNVYATAFSPSGKWMATSGWEGNILLWEVNLTVPGWSVEPTGKLPGTWGEMKRTELFQNFPNPFNPETWFPFTLSEPEHVKIRIYTSAGQLIRTLDLGQKPPGAYLSKEKAAYWDGTNESGETAASDVYFYVMEAGGHTGLKKMVLAR